MMFFLLQISSILFIVIILINHCSSYKLNPTELSIINTLNLLTDLRNDFSKHFMESISLPILAPILVQSGAVAKGIQAIKPSEIEQQIKNPGLGTVVS